MKLMETMISHTANFPIYLYTDAYGTYFTEIKQSLIDVTNRLLDFGKIIRVDIYNNYNGLPYDIEIFMNSPIPYYFSLEYSRLKSQMKALESELAAVSAANRKMFGSDEDYDKFRKMFGSDEDYDKFNGWVIKTEKFIEEAKKELTSASSIDDSVEEIRLGNEFGVDWKIPVNITIKRYKGDEHHETKQNCV